MPTKAELEAKIAELEAEIAQPQELGEMVEEHRSASGDLEEIYQGPGGYFAVVTKNGNRKVIDVNGIDQARQVMAEERNK